MLDIFKLAGSKIFKNIIKVFLGDISSAVLSAIAAICAIRVLGPSDFGLVALVITVISFVSLLADPGIFTGLVRFGSRYSKEDPEKAKQVFKISFFVKLAISSLLSIALSVLAGWIAGNIFKKPGISMALRLAGIGVFGSSMIHFLNGYFQARQEFGKYVLVNTLPNAIKLVCILVLIYLGAVNTANVIYIYVVAPIFGFLIGYAVMSKGFLLKGPINFGVFNELYGFTKWVFISAICVKIASALDIFMLGRFKDMDSVGIYSAGQRVVLFLSLIQMSINRVLFPEVSKFVKKEEFKKFIRYLFEVILIVAVITAAIFIAADYMVVRLFGSQYAQSALILKILLVGFFMSTFLNPLGMIIYSENKPHLLAITDVLQLGTAALALYLLIPSYGPAGAAWAVTLARLPALLLIPFFVHRIILLKNE